MKQLLKQVERHYTELFTAILEEKDSITSKDLRALCELGYFSREIARMLKDLQVEFDKISALAQKIACLKWIQTEEELAQVETNEFKCSPQLQMSANIPSHSKEPEKYIDLLKWLGVEEEVASKGLLRVHWPTLRDLLTEMQELGKPLPNGISADKTHAHYSLKYKTKGGSEK